MELPELNFKFFENDKVKQEVRQILADNSYVSKSLNEEAATNLRKGLNQVNTEVTCILQDGNIDVFTQEKLDAFRGAVNRELSINTQRPHSFDSLDHRIGPAVAAALSVHDIPSKPDSRFTAAVDTGANAVFNPQLSKTDISDAKMVVEVFGATASLVSSGERPYNHLQDLFDPESQDPTIVAFLACKDVRAAKRFAKKFKHFSSYEAQLLTMEKVSIPTDVGEFVLCKTPDKGMLICGLGK